MSRASHHHPSIPHRPGSSSILVIVVVVLLAFAIYAFSSQVELDYASMRVNLQASQLRNDAYSRLAWLEANVARQQGVDRIRWLHDSHDDQSSLEPPLELRSVWLIPGWSHGLTQRGLVSEAAKLDLNALDLSPAKAIESRSRLLALPKMSAEMADAILDWLDPDDNARPFGAEAAWYRSQGRKIIPRNGPMLDLSELMLVRGFDQTKVYGEDQNRNGWLDWNENDGSRTLPEDNADGELDLGYAEYFCLDSFESNLQANGRPKIYLNDEDLTRLYARVESQFGRDAATFIVAYRLDGPYRQRGLESNGALQKELDETLIERVDAQLRADATPKVPTLQKRSRTHPSGLDLTRIPRHRIRSLFDLIDSKVVTLIGTSEQLLESPWNTGNNNTAVMVTRMTELFTCDFGARRRGGVDARHATYEVLTTIPGMNTESANSIVRQRETIDRSLAKEYFTTPLWLLEARLVSLEELQMLAPFLAFQPANYSGYAVGQDARAERAMIVRFRLSCEGESVRLLELRDIGYQRIRRVGS